MRKAKTTLALALALAAALCLAPLARADSTAAYQLADMMSGIFVSATPNNSLRLDIQSITTDPLHSYDLFLSVSGKFEETNVRQQGLIRIESQGRDIYFGYVPHFDPTITALSPGAGRFNDREATAACGFTMKSKGDGFAGETLGSQCAIAMRGAYRKWSVEVEPGTITLRDAKSGETLRFRKQGKAEKSEKSGN